MLSVSRGPMFCTDLSGQSESLYMVYVLFFLFNFAHILDAAKGREELVGSLHNI